MLVQDIMTRQVVAIGPDVPIRDATGLMQQRNVRHFPIVESGGGDRLVGIVSDRDVRTVGSEHPSAPPGVTMTSPVREVMSSPVVTAHPLDPVEEAARVLRERKIGAMPVVEEERLVGIVTGTDFLDALVRMTGVYEAASRLEVELPDRPGALAGLLTRLASKNLNVSSVMPTRRERDAIGFALRVNTINARGLAQELEREGYEVLWPLDLRRG